MYKSLLFIEIKPGGCLACKLFGDARAGDAINTGLEAVFCWWWFGYDNRVIGIDGIFLFCVLWLLLLIFVTWSEDGKLGSEGLDLNWLFERCVVGALTQLDLETL